jgi:hypothetical protein
VGGCGVQVDSDALAEMKKKQNTESLRITELQGLIAGMKDEIEVKVSHMSCYAFPRGARHSGEKRDDGVSDAMSLSLHGSEGL